MKGPEASRFFYRLAMNLSLHTNNAVYAWVRSIVLVAIGLTLSETFLVLGVFSPVAIEGSSMAPTVLGPHVEVECPHCGLEFAVGADQRPTGSFLFCPDCRQTFTASGPGPLWPGRRVWVDRTWHELHDVRRWDVVVFRCPERAGDYCIKRVLGLPGEHVDFEKGDLLINGQVVRKTYEQQMRLRQQVHVERESLLAWYPPEAGWRFASSVWQHEAGESPLHFAPVGDLAVTNELGVNQGAMIPRSDALDLMVTCRVHLQPGAQLRMVAEFADGTRYESPPITGPEAQVVWSLFDRQALLAVDGQVVYREPHEGRWIGPPGLSLVATGSVAVGELTVWRDVYYHTRPVDLWPAEGVQLGPDRLFVVGDNVAISSDSRNWQSHALPLEMLIGRPIGVD